MDLVLQKILQNKKICFEGVILKLQCERNPFIPGTMQVSHKRSRFAKITLN